MTDQDLDLDRLEALANAATEGPWGARELPQMVRGANATLHSAHGTGEVWSVEFSPEIGSTVSIPDAEFIAASRTAAPALIAEVRRLRATVERVREIHAPIEALNVRAKLMQKVCTGCGTDDGNWQNWPCPTLRALDGEESK